MIHRYLTSLMGLRKE